MQVRNPEEWRSIADSLPVPDELWQGVFGEVAQRTRRGWEVWAATYAALSAWAGRNLHFQYVGSPMYGMSYVLCLAPTGQGKEAVAEIGEALTLSDLPGHPTKEDSPQSGEGLFPLLTDYPERSLSQGLKVLLVCREWGRMLQTGKVEHSTLFPALNELFNRRSPWGLSRSTRNQGGGKQKVKEPCLSILATTTLDEARSKVSEHMIHSGFLNRYLILPGPTDRFIYMPEEDDPRLYDAPGETLQPVVQEISAKSARKWGEGQKWIRFLSPEAKDILRPWGQAEFEGEKEVDPKKPMRARLHFYSYQIALMSAFWRGADEVSTEDALMSKAVCEASSKFVDLVWGDEVTRVPESISFYGKLEERTLEVMGRWAEKKKPWFCNRKRLREELRAHFQGSISFQIVDKTLLELMKSGQIITLNHEDYKGQYALTGTSLPKDDELSALDHDRIHRKGDQHE